MKNIILNPEEMIFLKKLCQPESFVPTPTEGFMLEVFKKGRIIKIHKDGTVEVTEFGADCYTKTLDLNCSQA